MSPDNTRPTAPHGSSARPNIAADVRALVTNVVSLAKHLGDNASAELLAARATGADTTATIVVAGEAKQGKSSLINSLIGVEELSPVDADIATAVPMRIGHGPTLTATVNLTTGDRLAVAPGELSEWVSMVGASLEQLRRVASVEVTVPSRLLEPGVVLVDTPGVGGLVAGHAKMTLRSLESATALVFVTDADTVLTRPELEFLARAGERVASVLFVVTKTDASPHWQLVVEEDREVLSRFAPRLRDAPMVAVSARLAARARALAETDRELSTALWAESGVGKLQGWIGRRIRPVATTLAVANTVALSRSIVTTLHASAQRRLAAATADPAVTAALAAEQARVAELRNHQLTWATSLERQLFEARTQLRDRVRTSSDSLRSSAMELVKASRSRDTNRIVAQIDAEIDAQAQELSAAVSETAASVCSRMLTSLNIASPLELTVARSGAVTIKQFEPAAPIAMNVLTGSMAALSGWGLVARLTGQSAVSTALGTVGIASGAVGLALPLLGAAGIGYAIQHIRATVTHRAELGMWVRAEIDRATSERYSDVERVLTSAKLDIMEVVRAGLVERDRDVSAALDQARAARVRSEQERAARERADRKVVAAASGLMATADELLDALLTASSLTAASMTASTTPGSPRVGTTS